MSTLVSPPRSSFLPNVRGASSTLQSPPSETRISVQQAAASTTKPFSSSPSLTQQPLPRLSSSTSLKESTSTNNYRSPAATTSLSDTAPIQPSSSPIPALGLRIVDARFDTVDSSNSDQPSVWSQLHLDDINAGLASPLTAQEIALNNVHRRKARRTKEDLAAEAAHRAIEVSKLVDSYPIQFGVSLVGSRPRILFLQLENIAPSHGRHSAIAPNSPNGIETPLDTISGEIHWRARLPNELETSVEHWATLSSNPTDEERYHAACVEREIFTIRPKSGKLIPGQNGMLEVIYHPKFVGEHVVPLLIQVRGGKHFTLILKGTTVEQIPSQFSFVHLKEILPVANRRLLNSKDDEEEESKEQPITSSINPFLPYAAPPALLHTFHPVPIGFSADNTPIQTFQLFNHSNEPLQYRVALASLKQLAKDNYDVEILSLVNTGITRDSEFLLGEVAPHNTGILRFKFRPLELKTYSCPVSIYVQSALGGSEVLQEIILEGTGVTPSAWSIAPFPSLSSRPAHQSLSLPGQLLQISNEEVNFSDVPLFSRSSRLFTIRSLVNSELNPNKLLEYAFVHSIRVPPSKWNATLATEFALRRCLNEDEDEVLNYDENDNSSSTDETLHLTFTPSSGFLAPGESIQIRCDLYGGDRTTILERDVKVYVRLLDEQLEATSSPQTIVGNGFGSSTKSFSATATGAIPSSQEQLDTFGYNQIPSLALTNRLSISSSQPHPNKFVKFQVERETRRAFESVTGVGAGFAGQDVRVDYPPKPVLPLQTNTITRRKESGTMIEEGTAHLASSMAELHSVPNRATWFADADAPVASLLTRTTGVHHLFIRGRILTLAQLEKDQLLRAESLANDGGQSEKNLLPQQSRTELTSRKSDVSQRFFISQVDLTRDAATPATTTAASVPAKVQTDPVGITSIESALHQLLRDGLRTTTVRQSFQHLTHEPVPFFTDLLGPLHSKPKTPSRPSTPNDLTKTLTATASMSIVTPLATSSPHFQNLSESILNDALFSLLSEASQPTSEFDLDSKQPPKIFVRRRVTTSSANSS